MITREEWLNKLSTALQSEFHEEGLTLPRHRISTGFPSRRGISAKKRTIGQCWTPKASADGTTELIISITKSDSMTVAGILAHEMVHAVIGVDKGHRAPFKRLATLIGLEGQMTATTESDTFKQRVQPILDTIGCYPHAKLDANMGVKKQSTRMLKITCVDCGMIFRTSKKWLDVGPFKCPLCNGTTEIS